MKITTPKKEAKFNTLIDVVIYFSDENVALDHLKNMRWANGAYCPHCGCEKVYAFSDNKRYKCKDCRKQFTAKVGTIFEDSKIPLAKWFAAIYLISSHKKGISSLQLAKDLGITQKSAWFMLHRLRFSSQTDAFQQPLKNIVEVDETYIGGKEKNKHRNKKTPNTQGRSTATKTAVLAVIERGGKLKAQKSDRVDGRSIGNFLRENVVIGSQVMSDEFRIYNSIKWLYNHQIVNHGSGEYVNEVAHTNTVEGFFSLLKRGIIGIYHYVSPKHLDQYLKEFAFRYNTKDYTEQERFNLMISSCNNKRLTYQDLIQN